jgi:DNA-binding NarL/FixJ family response regulator
VSANGAERQSTDRGVARVLLVDDQTLVRAGFRLVLDRDPDIEVVAEAVDGEQACDLAVLHRPDVVLMDVRMPRRDGIDATRIIAADERLAGTRVVVLTTYERDDYIVEAIRAGAVGFLLKDVEPAELRRAIHLAVAGEALLSPSVAARVLDTVRDTADQGPQAPERLEVLTDREREVVALVGRGLTNAEIGAELYMSPATAKTHVSRAMMKLQARDRVRLAIIAHETGLVGR